MGWQHEEHGLEHEGYLIGLVDDGGRGLFRELTLRHDGNIQDAIQLEHVSVGCDCGWRSSRMRAPSGTEWTPCQVWLAQGRDDSIAEGYEESARKIWLAHVADVREHGAPMLRVDEDGMRRAWDRAVARRVDERKNKI